MRHIMLDLETMGTAPGSAIVAIGAAEFSVYKIGETFSVNIDLSSSVAAGLRIDAKTVLWWLQQSDAARSAFTKECKSMKEALVAFADWIGDSETCVWGDGAAFDNVLLMSAYRVMKLRAPWSFVNDRCFRTMKNMFPVDAIASTEKHVALADAVSQAEQMIAIIKKYEVALQ